MNPATQFTGNDPRINRKGRPKAGHSVAEYARSRTRNGRELIEFYCKVFRDPKEPMETRLKAAFRIEDRAFGKTPISIEGMGGTAAAAVNVTLNVDPFSRPEE